MSYHRGIVWTWTVRQLFIFELLFIISVDMWQDHSNCGYQRAPLKPEPSIVGGHLAQHGEYPWIASLLEHDSPVCGATLIAPDWLITAAHCIEVLNDGPVYSVLMGTADVIDVHPDTYQLEFAEEIYLHPNYRRDDTDWDIALVRLQNPMNLTKYVTTACLPNREMRDRFYPGQAVTMSGWGALEQAGRQHNLLHEVTVPLVNHTVCRKEYYPFPISDNMICTGPKEGGKDSCQGDSGGPTVTKVGDQWWLVGVIIGGVGCAIPGFRGVSSDTIAYQDWINPIFEGGVPEKKIVTCESYDFTCQGGWCIPYSAKCDGFPDCRLQTDEAFCDGFLKLFDPYFYRRVADRTAAVIIPNIIDIHICARRCLFDEFPCGVFEYYIAGTMIDLNNETQLVYDCLIARADAEMVDLPTPESKRINFHQFVLKTNISSGDNAVFSTGTDVILSPAYLPVCSLNQSSFYPSTPSKISWTIRLSEEKYNTIIFKMLASKGHIDCGNCSSFSLLSINGGGTVAASTGKVGIARCLNEFVVGETFNVDSAEVIITNFATDFIGTGFILEYNARWLCNQSFIASPGSISSPRFYSESQVYPPNIRCHYSITAPPDQLVSLHMDSYKIEPDMEEGACDFDSLSIFDGNSTDAQRLEYLCGFGRTPVSVVSNSSSLHMVFITDESGEYAGFVASFSFIKQREEGDGEEEQQDFSSYHDVSDFDNEEELVYESSKNSYFTTSTPAATSSKEMTTIPEERTTFLSSNSHLRSTTLDLQYLFKVSLVVFLLVFVMLAIVFAVLYCRIKDENAKLKKKLQIHQNGNIVSL